MARNIKDFTEQSFESYLLEIEKIDRKIQRAITKEGVYCHNVEGSFEYIPMHNSDVLFSLITFLVTDEIFAKKPATVLDVGCGTGRIVKILQDFGIKARGIEFHSPYVKRGRKGFKLSEEDLVVGDAFEITPEFLSEFSVIYTYMPLYNRNSMVKLHLELYMKAQYGTILVEMLPEYYPMNLAVNIKNYRQFPFGLVKKEHYYNW